MGLEFRILGPLEVRASGRPLEVPGAKQKQLLSVLLLRANQVVSSESLIDAIWGEDPPETARKALQMHVSQLRRALADGADGDPVIVTRSPGYRLQVDPSQIDLTRFERLLDEAAEAGDPRQAAESLREALALWRGPALCDVDPGDGLRGEASRLDELRLGAIEDRIESDLALGDHAAVIAELDALCAEHPLRERPRAQLMLALYRSGRQADALAVYQDARRVLVDELGIEPGHELRGLETRILTQDPGLESPQQGIESGHLVGREQEWADLVPVVDAALKGSGAMVLLAGEPGIGKSRLAEALARHAHDRGADVVVGRCWEAGGAPAYWPWVQALSDHVRETDEATLRSQLGEDGAELAAILPDLPSSVRAGAAQPRDGDRFRLFAAIAGFLRRSASSRPMALFLDDLHAADPSSLLLLRFMADELARAPLLIVGCYRDSEVGPTLAQTLDGLARQDGVHRLTLRGLTAEETAQLLLRATGTALPDDLVERVHERSEGNPLFAVETGRLLASEGARQGEPLPVPAGVSEAIGQRLHARSPRCRELLLLASVIGREFRVEALERAGGLDAAENLDALEEAEAARLIGPVPGARGRLRFSHMLVREALYDDLPAARRMRLHRQVAVALDDLYAANPDPHSAELAHHHLLAGSQSTQKAIEHSIRAGRSAASQYAYEEAVRHYRRALEVLEGGAGDPAVTCDVLILLGEVLSRAGEEEGSRAALREAAILAERHGRADQLARAALSYGGRLTWQRATGDPGLIPLLERALASVPEDGVVRAQLLARLAGALRDEPLPDRRVRLAREAVELATTLGDAETLAVTLDGLANAIEGPEGFDEHLTLTAELISQWERLGVDDRLYFAHDHRLNAFWRSCERPGVDLQLDVLDRLADELQQPAQRWALGTAKTMLALMEGRLEEAESLISETAVIGKRAAPWNAEVSRRIALFVLRREQGELAGLEATIRRSALEYPALLRFGCALAHLQAELGHETEARETVAELVRRDLAREYRDAEWLFSLSVLADACASLADEAAAAQIHALLLPYEHLYAVAPVEAVFGSVARALGVLASTAKRFDQAERHFAIAIETERRMHARPWMAHAERGLATMLLARRGSGDVDRARTLLRSARATYDELGMRAWSARCDAVG